MKRRFAVALAIAALFCGPMAARADTGPLIIDQARPDRAPVTVEPEPPSPSGSGRVEAAPAAFTPFILRQVRVQGSTIAPEAVGEASRPFVGKTVDAADLRKIAEAIGEAYARSDIALYTIQLPRQTFEGGVLTVVVIEGHVSDVQVTSQSSRDLRLTQAYAERLKSPGPLRRSTLQRYVSLMRDIPGSTVDVQLLQAGPPGAVRLAIDVKKRRWRGGLSINNRGSPYLGRTQVEASMTLNGALREGQQTRLTVAFPTEVERFQYVALSHAEPLGPSGATLNLSLGRLHTKPEIAGFSLSGDATTAGAQVVYPMIRSDRRNLFLTGGVDGLNSDNALFGRRISTERTRVLRVAAAFSDATPRRALSLSGTASQGLDGLGARMADPLVDASFTKLNVQAGWNRLIGKQVTVRLAASAQYAGGRLPASEQFTYGGPQFGRAFASAVAVGDTGYAGSAEVAWRPAKVPKTLAGSELYGFTDAGHVAIKAAPFLARNSYDLSSAGVGVRLALASKGMVEIEAAKALKNPMPGNNPWRLMVSVRSTF